MVFVFQVVFFYYRSSFVFKELGDSDDEGFGEEIFLVQIEVYYVLKRGKGFGFLRSFGIIFVVEGVGKDVGYDWKCEQELIKMKFL